MKDKNSCKSNNKSDIQKFSYREVLAMIFAAYKVFLPKFLIPVVVLFIIALLLKIYLSRVC